MNALPEYQVFAIRYAYVDRVRRENFIDTHDAHDLPMPMDYFIWLIRCEDQVFLVDTGFNQSAADARGRRLLRCPIRALEALGLSAADVTEVIITHMHYDHAGNVDLLPQARFHLQECGFHAIRPPSPLSSGQAFHGHLATCSTAIRPGSRSAATQGGHC